jgi:hypothetical protein
MVEPGHYFSTEPTVGGLAGILFGLLQEEER